MANIASASFSSRLRPTGQAELLADLAVDPRHPGDLRRGRVHVDRDVAEVLHHQHIDAVLGEDAGLRRAPASRTLVEAVAAIARAARQRRQLHHADDRLRAGRDEGEQLAHQALPPLRPCFGRVEDLAEVDFLALAVVEAEEGDVLLRARCGRTDIRTAACRRTGVSDSGSPAASRSRCRRPPCAAVIAVFADDDDARAHLARGLRLLEAAVVARRRAAG